MISRFMELERRTLLVQFIAVDPLTFYATSDGTDLVQNILRTRLARADADILGQEGSLSVGDTGEFLSFEPTDTKNRTLHLPIEHLAYCGALRRMRRDPSDHRNPDQILQRDFENVDLANRYAHYIVGPPIFVAIFHGFDNALCYTFVTQSTDDACLAVMKLTRAFRTHEQQRLEEQGQINQGFSPHSPMNSGRPPSPIIHAQSNLPQQTQLHSPPILPPQMSTITANSYYPNSSHDPFIESLLANPNIQVVNSPYPSFIHQNDGLSIISNTQPISFSSVNPSSTIVTHPNPSTSWAMSPNCLGNPQVMNGSTSYLTRPPSPPIISVPGLDQVGNMSLGGTLPPQVIYKPSNQQVTYKQNVFVRWLKPPTPPPPAPIIIREIQHPPEIPPPIICRQVPPCPPTPPPIVVREPPPCPAPTQPVFINKHLPRTCLPPQVVVQRCQPPPPKPPAIIYEKYLPPPCPPARPVVVQRTTCQPQVCQPQACGPQGCTRRRVVREIVRQVPQQCAPVPQPAVVCTQGQQQHIIPGQATEQLVPVFATRQNIVQPKGIRVIRQVIGPAQSASMGQVGLQQLPPQMFPASGLPYPQSFPTTLVQ